MKNEFEIIIENCARCNKTHKVKFIALSKPIVFSAMGLIEKYTHWAQCPELNEPVLLKIMRVR